VPFALPVGGITLAAMIVGLGACSSPAPPTFDLSAPTIGRVAKSRGQLAVSEPVAMQTLNSQQIVVRDAAGAVSALPGAQWGDRLPALVQTRLIQSFENAGRLGQVGRPGDGTIAAFQLATELRQFQVRGATNDAVVEIAARVINAATGQVVASRIFSAQVPIGKITGPAAAVALDQALGDVLAQIVRWA
jgi:cholesterol transport system auxiliary component